MFLQPNPVPEQLGSQDIFHIQEKEILSGHLRLLTSQKSWELLTQNSYGRMGCYDLIDWNVIIALEWFKSIWIPVNVGLSQYDSLWNVGLSQYDSQWYDVFSDLFCPVLFSAKLRKFGAGGQTGRFFRSRLLGKNSSIKGVTLQELYSHSPQPQNSCTDMS